MIDQMRSEFLISVIARDPVIRIKMKQTLMKAGYTVSDFDAGEAALVEIRGRPPHLVCYYVEESGMSIRNWIETIASVSQEILTVAVASPLDLEAAKLLEQGAHDLIWMLNLDFPDLVSRIDRAAQSLLEKFEIQDLREQLKSVHATSQIEVTEKITEWEEKRPLDIRTFLADLRRCSDVNAIVKEMARHIAVDLDQQVPVFIFRYLPGYQSLLALAGFAADGEMPAGTGLNWRRLERADRERFRANPEEDPNMQRLLHMLANEREWTWQRLNIGENLFDGWIAIGTQELGELTRLQLEARIEVAQIAAELFDSRFRLHREQLRDSATGVWKRGYFEQRLTEEARRAYRLKSTLTVLRMRVQRWDEIVDEIGDEQSDALLKYMGTLLNQSSRTTDVIGYWGRGEFVMALPHTSQDGGEQRRMRLTQALEHSQFPMLPDPLQRTLLFQFGTGSYPEPCDDLDALMTESAGQLDSNH